MEPETTYEIILGERSTFRGTREAMRAHLRDAYGLTVVKRGYTTWRLYAGDNAVGRVDEA